MSVKTVRFPILTQHYASNYDIVKRAPGSLPWAMIEEHAAQCVKNHDQSVARLAERGGLDPWEAVAVLEDRDLFLPRNILRRDLGRGRVSGSEGKVGDYSAHEIVERLWAIHDDWIRRNP